MFKKLALFLFFLFAFSYSLFAIPANAQSPLDCGYLNEFCCNLASGPPNSCKDGVGLACVNGRCVPDGTSSTPPTRTDVANASGAICGETEDPEFHSLRPYPMQACGGSVKARYCSNDLVFIEDFDMAHKSADCSEQMTAPGPPIDFTCDPGFTVEEHTLYVQLDDSHLPIMGNTEDQLDDATKVNEYASWYLNGVIDKAENKDATDEQIVNFSGPIRKLLPGAIQDAQKIKIIKSATNIITEFDADLGEDVTSLENHDQLVVDTERLSSWGTGNLDFLRTLTNTAGVVGNIATNGLLNNLNLGDAWNSRMPPLPWDDGTGKPFGSSALYQQAYGEWQGKSCAIIPILNITLCIDNPLISNKYADLWHFVPLSNNSDKKGSEYIAGGGDPQYIPSAGTEIGEVSSDKVKIPPLYFAHMQEVKDLSELLNQSYMPKDVESVPLPETTEYNNCSVAVVRTNKGDNLFPGDPNELQVPNITYPITQATCHEIWERIDTTCPISEYPGGPVSLEPCSIDKHELECPAQITVKIKTGTKTPWAKEIYSTTVADSGSTFRKIFPKVGEGAPVSCIANIPTITDVTYEPDIGGKSEIPNEGGLDFRVDRFPEDGTGDSPQLTFPHIGSIYEYFLKGIQTALRPKGYGEPIVNGTMCETEASKQCDVNVKDSSVPSKYLGSFKDNFIDLADRWSAKCPGSENNFAEECYNYVAATAQRAGVNPAFALTIWLNESGASNYCEGGETTQDMGINLSEMYQNLSKQLATFTAMANMKLCEGVAGFTEPMNGWLSRLQSSAGACDPTDTKAMDYYAEVRDTTWLWVTGCPKNGKFGITWPTDMGCP